ncbi:hypothetical protein N8342_05825 [Acidimicrobiales bacterium]|nr:hypothetical protein [bacterium]MDC1389346.1 hypothetical protein [Acidimicrobiales bacterium]
MHTRTLLSSELWVPLASVIAGLGAFGFIAISSRSLGLDDYVPIGQLWSIWALAFAVVSFTSQQTVVRGHVIRREVPRSFVTGDELLPLVLLSIPLAVVVFVWNEQIFRSGSYWWPFLAMAMPFGTLLSGTTRGLWAASGRLAGLSFVIAGENVIRVLGAAVLAATGAPAPWFAAAIVAGFAIGFFRPSSSSGTRRWPSPPAEPGLAAATAATSLMAHASQVGAPVLLALHGADAREVSALFAVLAIYRAPYQLALGLVPRIAAMQVLAFAEGQQLRQAVRLRGLAGLALVAMLGGFGAAILGELVVSPLFGAAGILSDIDHLLGAVLVILGIGNLGLTVLRVATGRGLPLLVRRGTAALVGVVLLAAISHDITTVLLALVVMEGSASLTLSLGADNEWQASPTT